MYTALLILAVLVLAGVLLVGALYLTVRRSLPKIQGELRLLGLREPVNVYRDSRGVPHIEAKNRNDLYMAQGFVTAQDRLWQMDMMRRLASGKLSEIMGAGTVTVDKFYRTLLMRQSAETSYGSLQAESIEVLESFCAGVNAYIDQAANAAKLPPEFLLLRYKPERWEPIDTLLIFKLLSFSLGMNVKAEVFRHELRKIVGDEMLKQIMPRYPKDGYVTVQSNESEPSPAAERSWNDLPEASRVQIEGLLEMMGTSDSKGSNSWVVSGALTKSGKPLLANDPHLEMQNPCIWYQSHLVLDSEQDPINVIGVTVPGMPGVMLGHNEHLAWGVTSAEVDVQDLFIEKRNPDNPLQFEFNGQWEDAQVHREVIKVKGRADVACDVIVTRHGPLISEVMGEGVALKEEAMALRWSAHQPTTELEALIGCNRATNVEEFMAALSKFQAPCLNFLFASAKDGTIGLKTTGLIPVRAAGDGVMPVPGWTGEFEWVGFIPFEELPEIINPPSGYIVSANNKIIGDYYPYLLTRMWNPPFRAQRIANVLGAGHSFDAEDMRRLQLDFFNLEAQQLLPVLLPVLQQAELTGREAEGVELLAGWNFVDDAEQAAPFVYHLFWEAITIRLFERKFGKFLFDRMNDKVLQTDEMLLEAARGQANDWIREAGGFEHLVLASYRDALEKGVKELGTDMKAWRWGRFHTLGPKHPIGAEVKFLKFMNPKVHAVGGSNVTVGVMTFIRKTGEVVDAAPWRMVVDLADLATGGQDIIMPGQHGHFLSPWYEDQSAPHIRGELQPQLFLPSEYRRGKKLVLSPAH